GVARIQEQIQEYLLELVRRSAHGRQSFTQLLDDLDLRRLQWMRYQRQCFFDYAVNVEVSDFGGAGAREVQQIIYDFTGTERLLHDLFDDPLARIAFGHLLRQHLDVIRDHREGSIDFVRHACGQQAE